MRSSLDKLAHISAYLYFALPFAVFVLGWLQWFVALPLILILTAALYFSYHANQSNFIKIDFIKNNKVIFICLGSIFIWTMLSGVGNIGMQTEDHHYRNAIFRDLVVYDWPVLYNVLELPASDPLQGQTTMLVYYMGYWLPSAVVGKVFGQQTANLFLFLWTFIGLTLVFYFLSRKFKQFSVKIVLILIFFGGLSIIGQYIDNQSIKLYYPRWAGDYVYSSNTWNFFYVFNQLIAPWLLISLIINDIPKKNIFFVYALCFLQGPFSFIGLLPYIIWYSLKDFSFGKILAHVKDFLSFQNIIASLIIVITSYLYFSSNQAASTFKIVPFSAKNYLLFVILEFGIIAAIIFNKYKTNSLYYLVVIMLLVIPFIQLGTGRDFVERVSIPSLFILMFLVIDYLYTMPSSWTKKALVICLLIGALAPVQKVVKSLTVTSLYYTFNSGITDGIKNEKLTKLSQKYKNKEILICDSLKTVNTKKNQYTSNFMGITSKSKFYQTIARKK